MAIDGARSRCHYFPCHAAWGAISEAFGLSAKKTPLARRLIAGHFEESIARDLGISFGRVRTKAAVLGEGVQGKE
ncbi:MAG: hypothetical protein ACLQNE_45925 [Thermoguttaceae bacterium]